MNIRVAHRSVSQLKTFSRCGELYRLERTTDIPERPAAWTAAGHAFHTAYEGWELTGRKDRLSTRFEVAYKIEIDSMMATYPDLSVWQKTPRTKTVEKDISLRGLHGFDQAEVYEAHCRMNDWVAHKVEWPFELKLGNVLIRGQVDAILKWPDGTYTIRDIKTGNREVDNRQLGVYKLAVNKFLGLNVQWGEYWYTKDGANREVDLRRYTTEYLTEQFEALNSAILNGQFIANPGKQCDLCGVKAFCREMGWKTIE